MTNASRRTPGPVVPPEPPRQNDVQLLKPQLRAKLRAWQVECHLRGLPQTVVLETGRTEKRARWLYGWGRDWPGPKRTWTLHSPHLTGDAFDFAVLAKDGTIDWNNKAAYAAVGRVAEELGLQWGEKPGDGDVDLGHIQLRHPEEQPIHG